MQTGKEKNTHKIVGDVSESALRNLMTTLFLIASILILKKKHPFKKHDGDLEILDNVKTTLRRKTLD